MVSSRSACFVFIGWNFVLSSFMSDGLKGLSCILFSSFSVSDAFISPSLLFEYLGVSALDVAGSSFFLLGTDCVLLLVLTSLNIFSNLSFNSLLNSAISLFAFSVILCVHTCISFSFRVGQFKASSLFLTELISSTLLRVSIIVSLPCEASVSDTLISLSIEGDCPRLDHLFLLFPILVVMKNVVLLERRVSINFKKFQ